MKLSLGILAFNEAENIGRMIQSLCQQTIFQRRYPNSARLNSSVFQTVAQTTPQRLHARHLNSNLPPALPGMSLKSTVHVIPQAGKCNAWNIFVHELSDRNSSYLGLMDADIFSLSPDSIANMVRLLLVNSHVQVATDRPIKTISEGKAPRWYRKFSLATSRVGDPAIDSICGQLYIGRAQTLRQIWIPSGLFAEDGFIRACIVTDCFRSAEDVSRVRRAEGASHSFEGEAEVRSIIRHQKQLVIGNYINMLLFGFLWSVSSGEDNPLRRLRSECENNPAWVGNLIRDNVASSSEFVLPKSFTWSRWHRLKGLSLLRKIAAFPVVFGGWIFDFYVARISEATLRRGQGLGVR